MKIVLEAGDERQELRVLRRGDRLRVTLEDGRTLEAKLLADGNGVFELELDGVRIHGAGISTGPNDRQLWVGGQTLKYRRVTRGAAERSSSGGGDLSVVIPATVVEVLTNVGDSVEAGDKLVLLESMKMVLPIIAPRAGVVSAIHCAVGDSVAAGVPLVELEPESSSEGDEAVG